MKHDQTRKSPRLSYFDYSTPGAYFVTINSRGRKSIFGKIRNGVSYPNEIGQLIIERWNELPAHHPGIELDEFIVMPNHVHGIIFIMWDQDKVGAAGGSLTVTSPANLKHSPIQNRTAALKSTSSLTEVINGLKSAVTREYRRINPQWQGSVWNRSFYDHVIRNEDDLYECRQYIQDNPGRWSLRQ